MKKNLSNPRIRVRHPPEKPLLVFDGDYGFCLKWAARWRFLTGGKVDYEPYQKAAAVYAEIPLSCFQRAVQFIEPDGSVHEGARAVYKSLGRAAPLGWFSWAYDKLPGFGFISDKVYSFVAGHRHFPPGVDSRGLPPADRPPGP